MRLEDRFQHSITVDSTAALDAYHEGVDTMFTLQPGAVAKFDAAIELDPEFSLAFAARARAHLADADAAAARADAEQALALTPHRSERERAHVQIVYDGLHGKPTLDAIYAHARAYPRDAIAISGALGVYGLIAFSGIADHHQVQLDFLRSLEPYWDADWWFDTARGWARIEGGEVASGLDIAERALAANPINAQCVHAVSHGYYETGRVDRGAEFLDEWLASGVDGGPYSTDGGLHCHLSWHRALIALQLGDVERAAEIYTRAIAPGRSTAVPMLTYIDAAALAFRSSLAGRDFDAPTLDAINAYDEAHFQTGIAFLDLHRALVAALRHDNEYLLTLGAELDRIPGDHGGRRVVVDVIQAALRNDDAVSDAAQILKKNHAEFVRLGGSNAQRDILIDWEIDTLRRAGELDNGHALMRARQTTRAPHLDEAWYHRQR